MSGSTPNMLDNRIESEESPALFNLKEVNEDVSPTLLHILAIPGSAELPDRIHPYVTGGSAASPDSFYL